MQTATVPYIVATLISDEYVNDGRPQMHHHLIGHQVDSVYDLRTNYKTGWNQWPMVDLWARVPVTEFDDPYSNDMGALDYAKAKMGIYESYDGTVGW